MEADNRSRTTDKGPIPMNHSVTKISHNIVVALAGRMDPEGAIEVKGIITPLIAGRPHKLVLDLAGVNFIGSTGLRQLFIAARELNQNGGELVACGLQPEVARVFDLAVMPFRVFPTPAAALAD